MKNFKLLFVLGLFAVMGLVLLAEEPQGGGAQGTPAPAAAARGDQAIPTPPGVPPAGARGDQGAPAGSDGDN